MYPSFPGSVTGQDDKRAKMFSRDFVFVEVCDSCNGSEVRCNSEVLL